MKRILDLVLSIIGIIIFIIPMFIIALLVRITSEGPILYWSDRVGMNNVTFKMPKFRTMRVNTPAVATHLLFNSREYLTPIGYFFRKSSLDELPQLYNILKGEISFVGPRPALFNQNDLINLRTKKGIHKIIPGLTGWAQINGRDDLAIPIKVGYDEYYLEHRSFLFDLKILLVTPLKVARSEGVKH